MKQLIVGVFLCFSVAAYAQIVLIDDIAPKNDAFVVMVDIARIGDAATDSSMDMDDDGRIDLRRLELTGYFLHPALWTYIDTTTAKIPTAEVSDSTNSPFRAAAHDTLWANTPAYLTSETGDIEGVTAGTGLSGGGTTGTVTLNHAAHTGDVTGATELTITAQTIKPDDIDSTGEDFVFAQVYKGMSSNSDSQLVTIETIEDSLALCKRFLDTLSKSFVILNPEAANDFPFWQTKRALTIINVSAVSTAGTNVIGALDEYNATGTSVDAAVDADWTITTTEYTDASFTNAGIDAGDWLGWHTTSVSGSVTAVSITFEYTETY